MTPLRALWPTLLALAVMRLPQVALAQDFAGQRVKVTGTWAGDRILAVRIQERSAKDAALGKAGGRIGQVSVSDRTLSVGPVLVTWTDSTSFVGVSVTDLSPGRSVEVLGRLAAPGRLVASSIESGSFPAGVVEIVGLAGKSERGANGSQLLSVLGLQVEAPRRVLSQVSDLTRDPNRRRPANQLTFDLFHRPLTVGGEVATSSRMRRGFSLVEDAQDQTLDLEQQLQLELTYQLSPTALVFLRGQAGYESELRGDAPGTAWALERDEAWAYVGDIGGSGISLQLGRQNFREAREWWWGQDLDAIRLRFDRRALHAEVALAQELGPTSTREPRLAPEDQGIRRWLGQAAWRWRQGHRIDGFLLAHRDRSRQPADGSRQPAAQEDPADADLTWWGGRASGELDLHGTGTVAYWADAARVTGHETRFSFEPVGEDSSRVSGRSRPRVDGSAFDVGLSWSTRLPARPTLTLGYARGSGDPSASGSTDHAFRQTGLQRNKGRFEGVDRFRYYGELLRPELTNLAVWTVSGGVSFFRSSSVELVFHSYRQVYPATTLPGTSLDADPLGRDRGIGNEADIVVGLQEWEHLEFEIVGALFQPGAAYGSAARVPVHTLSAEVNYNF